MFRPSRKVSGKFSATERGRPGSSSRPTSRPFSVTRTRLTPCPLRTSPASATPSCSTRAWSRGSTSAISSPAPGGGACARTGPGPASSPRASHASVAGS